MHFDWSKRKFKISLIPFALVRLKSLSPFSVVWNLQLKLSIKVISFDYLKHGFSRLLKCFVK